MKNSEKRKARFLMKLCAVVVLLWIGADMLSQAILQYWQPDLIASILVFIAVLFIALAILGDRISEAF